MPRTLLIVIQSDYLIQIVDINSYSKDKQCGSRSVWIYTVCKGRMYPESAGLGLLIGSNQSSKNTRKAITLQSLDLNIKLLIVRNDWGTSKPHIVYTRCAAWSGTVRFACTVHFFSVSSNNMNLIKQSEILVHTWTVKAQIHVFYLHQWLVQKSYSLKMNSRVPDQSGRGNPFLQCRSLSLPPPLFLSFLLY